MTRPLTTVGTLTWLFNTGFARRSMAVGKG